MADNVDTQAAVLATVPTATKIATDQLAGGEHVQFVKIMDGTLDGSTKAAVGANGLAVSGPLTDTQLRATPVSVSTSSLPLPAGAATEATLLGVKTGTDRLPAQGQALMAASMPVVVASNQSALPIAGYDLDAGLSRAAAVKNFRGEFRLTTFDRQAHKVLNEQLLLLMEIRDLLLSKE